MNQKWNSSGHGPAALAQPPGRERPVHRRAAARARLHPVRARQPVLDDRPERQHAPASRPGARAARREACSRRCDAATSSTSSTSPTSRRSTPPRTRTRSRPRPTVPATAPAALGRGCTEIRFTDTDDRAAVRSTRTTTSSSAALRSSGGRRATAIEINGRPRVHGHASLRVDSGRQGNARAPGRRPSACRPSNRELSNIALPAYKFSGKTIIDLQRHEDARHEPDDVRPTGSHTRCPCPPNGVIYVEATTGTCTVGYDTQPGLLGRAAGLRRRLGEGHLRQRPHDRRRRTTSSSTATSSARTAATASCWG